MNELPKYTHSFLDKNDLWDSSWLMEKYPERFNKKTTTKGYNNLNI